MLDCTFNFFVYPSMHVLKYTTVITMCNTNIYVYLIISTVSLIWSKKNLAFLNKKKYNAKSSRLEVLV